MFKSNESEIYKQIDQLSRQLVYEKFIEDKKTFSIIEKEKEKKLKLWPKQKEVLEQLLSHKNNFIIQARQCGITTILALKAALDMVTSNMNEKPESILIVAPTIDQAAYTLSKVKYFLDQIPLKKWDFPIKTSSKSIYKTCSQKQIRLFNDAVIEAKSAASNIRGMSTITNLILQDAAFYDFKKIDILAEILPCVASNGKITMTSTPNKEKDNAFYNVYEKIMTNKITNWNIIKCYWFETPIADKDGLIWTHDGTYNTIKSTYYSSNIYEKLLEAGWKPTSDYYKKMCGILNNDQDAISTQLDAKMPDLF